MTQLLDTLRDPSSALNKVVLARQTKLDAPAGRTFDVLATVEQLRRSQPSATVFWYSDGEAGSFFGATPELLIEREGESVRTVALAGTCRRGVDADEDQALEQNLQSNNKERFEHQLVVEAIQQAFTRLGVEAIHEPAPRVRKLKQVQHLQTDISATGREAGHLLDYVFGLHPTPAVGGVPTTEALPWLRENEAMDRGAYAAPIGWLNADGEGSFYVALRSALVRGEQAWTFAGAGIVADSDADHEWREIEQKMATVTSALRIRSDSE